MKMEVGMVNSELHYNPDDPDEQRNSCPITLSLDKLIVERFVKTVLGVIMLLGGLIKMRNLDLHESHLALKYELIVQNEY